LEINTTFLNIILLQLIIASLYAQNGVYASNVLVQIKLDGCICDVWINITIINMRSMPFTGAMIPLFQSPTNVEAYFNNVKVPMMLSVRNNTPYLVFALLEPLNPGETGNLSVRFRTAELIIVEEDLNVLTLDYFLPVKTENFTLRVIIPESTGVVFSYPEAAVIVQQDGALKLEYYKKNLYENSTIHLTIGFRRFTNVHRRILRDVLVIIAISTPFIAYKFAIPYLRLRKAVATLTKDEAKVVKFLYRSGGRALQSDLVDKLGFSKAKASGVVSKLVDKGLLEKKPSGRTNLLILKL